MIRVPELRTRTDLEEARVIGAQEPDDSIDRQHDREDDQHDRPHEERPGPRAPEQRHGAFLTTMPLRPPSATDGSRSAVPWTDAWTGPDHRAIIGRLADCIDFMRRRPHSRSLVGCLSQEVRRVDAQEIKSAVAHQDAAPAAAEAPFVNLADPARVLGSDGRPAVSRRAPLWADIPDEQWNDWRWQLEPPGQRPRGDRGRSSSSPTRSATGLSAPDKFRVDITPYFISLIDPNDPNDPIRRQVIPTGREQQAFTGDDGGLPRRGPPLAGARASSTATRTGS